MKILHVTLSMAGASGVVTFVQELNSRLRSLGIESESDTVEDSSHLIRGNWDIIHIHGLWLSVCHRAAQWAKKNHVPVVWSTHGMTAPWSMHHKWWKKYPAWWLYQKRDLKEATIIHCTTEQEVVWNRRLGFDNCFVVPLGTNERQLNTLRTTEKNKEKILLFVGRIYPVKGLVNLIHAWKKIVSEDSSTKSDSDRWKLKIVGPDEARHKASLLYLVSQLGLEKDVEFTGPKFGIELSQEYENCDCLVLPSFTENFGATVVDALAHGKPCITSTFTPWKEIQDRGCGWWVSNEPSELAKAIREMMSATDETRHQMGMRGIALVEEKYRWEAVMDKMMAVYRRLLEQR